MCGQNVCGQHGGCYTERAALLPAGYMVNHHRQIHAHQVRFGPLRSNVKQMVKWSNGQMVEWSNGRIHDFGP